MWTAMAESNYRSEILSTVVMYVLIDSKENRMEMIIVNIQNSTKETLLYTTTI